MLVQWLLRGYRYNITVKRNDQAITGESGETRWTGERNSSRKVLREDFFPWLHYRRLQGKVGKHGGQGSVTARGLFFHGFTIAIYIDIFKPNLSDIHFDIIFFV
jgi:hypothetical protein